MLGRLADSDKRYGPLTVSRTKHNKWNAFYMYYEAFTDEDSEDNKEYNTLTIHFFTWFIIRLILPVMIKPIRYKVKCPNRSPETIERLGRDWYYEYRSKKYGFLLDNTHLTAVFGKTINDMAVIVNREFHWSYPWKELTPITLELYDQNNNLFNTIPKMSGHDRRKTPMTYFQLEDYDGEIVIASVHKEVRVYSRFGKSLKKLGMLLPKLRYYSLDIQFNSEVGREKGSWKGGTTGHSIDTTHEETAIEAMKRYCEKYGLKFVGFAGFGYGPFENKKETA